ncbi:Uncharacterized protein TCM_020765 [Theobroma cacao]|uniref:Uncharacterized protein n=1 Tax=Theobroma cacao TaxID=3641 RepID=A0A061EMI7_THECC|nr:Uncharacterized protein TCM_020765 [Theobroma cacao]
MLSEYIMNKYQRGLILAHLSQLSPRVKEHDKSHLCPTAKPSNNPKLIYIFMTSIVEANPGEQLLRGAK